MSMTVVSTWPTVMDSKKRSIDSYMGRGRVPRTMLRTARSLLFVVRGQRGSEQGNVVDSNHVRARAHRRDGSKDRRGIECLAGRLRYAEQSPEESFAARADDDRPADRRRDVTG